MKVTKHQTIQVCKHCSQRLGEEHRLDCPFAQAGKGIHPDDPIGPPPEGDPPSGPHGD
jgi:hypothetical protein